jgi:hypothetical protein
MATPFPEFTALGSIPQFLGYEAHGRLEDIFGLPIASDDASPEVSNPNIGQRAGQPLGDKIGREKEFTRNLPAIEANIKGIAETNEISEGALWSEILTILDGSGIGHSMYRTLDRPLGDGYGAREYVTQHAANGIAFIVRENVANWGARRHEKLTSFLGGLSVEALSNVTSIIYAGSGRPYTDAELWRPELKPYLARIQEDKKTPPLTEYLVAEVLHKPQTEELLKKLDLAQQVQVHAVEEKNPKASGDDVMRAVVKAHGQTLKDRLIVEIGNAPAGYTQLAGALVLAQELGIDPSEQYVAVTDSVELVHPKHFGVLDLERRSRVQNAATALNSFNGWLRAIVEVNTYMQARNKQNS